MQSYSYIYKGVENLETQLNEVEFGTSEKCLVTIFSGTFDPITAVEESKKIKKLLPNSLIFGATANAVTCNNIQYKQGNLIQIEKYFKSDVNTKIIKYKDTSIELLAKLTLDFIKENNSEMANILFGGVYEHPHEFVDAFNVLGGADIKLAGGVAGETNVENTIPFVFNDFEAVTDGVILATISNNISTYCDCNTSHEAISKVHTLTENNGIYWDEIDGEGAVEWLKKYLNIETLKGYSSWQEIVENDPLVRFEAVLEGHNGASRFLRYDETKKKIAQYNSTIPKGTKFRIGYSSPSKCVEKCYSMCCDIRRRPIESLFHYSCLFRMMYMNNCAKWELTPFANYNVSGAFLLGEIGWKDSKNEFFNGALVLLGLSESETYIMPDFAVFSDLDEIKSDNDNLIKFVLKKQAESKSVENELLLEQLVIQQERMQNEIMVDINLGIPNLIKYHEDKSNYNVDKICAIQIENADILIAYLGVERYYALARDFLENLKGTLNAFYGKLYLYSVSYSAVAIVASAEIEDDAFIAFTRNLHKRYQFFRFSASTTPVFNRFSVVTGQEYLVEVAMNMFHANRSAHDSYIISQTEEELSTSIKDELNMINIINRALLNDGVVPFYQGIRDNEAKNINKYEALMRLEDEDNTIYAPERFMQISKKYHMYRRLSDKMIDRVFSEVNQMRSDTIVSINISAVDIESNQFIENLAMKIEKVNNPENIIFEILEDESFNDILQLKKLTEIVKNFGCKIAIDDFGKGYSNLLEITNIQPDFLKIDGGIIRKSHSHTSNEIVVKTIIYLAEQLDIPLVAEYVENEAIQNVMERLNVRYSQGYLFSKPQRLEKILAYQSGADVELV